MIRWPQESRTLESLPLLTLYLSERCNSRCVTCDYWRTGTKDMSLASVRRLLPSLERLGTQVALLSGGEPLLNPEWQQIAAALRDARLKLWLLTSGLSLAKHAREVARLFDRVTVSLDGTDAATYQAIRGLDAFDKVCEGIRAAAAAGAPVTLRVTLQRANFRQLPEFVRLARHLGAQGVSFLAVDVANPHAFGRKDAIGSDLALRTEDLSPFAALLDALERDCAREFESGFIAESPRRLRHIHRYFSAVSGQGDYPLVRCNAPAFSAVLDAGGRVHPCFFIQGPPQAVAREDLALTLNDLPSLALRERIRSNGAPECRTCVCSIWHTRGPTEVMPPLSREPGHV
ncbi:MAG: radical SAM protein [Proteobacteria bacterium]|nr:radical SAM protein [Pseudomonadota bacterium]